MGVEDLGLALIVPEPDLVLGLARFASESGFVRVASPESGFARTAPDPFLGLARLAFVLGLARFAPDLGLARTASPPPLGLARFAEVLLLGLARTGAFEAGAFEDGAVEARSEDGAVEARDLDAGAFFEAGALERGLLLLLLPAWKEQPPRANPKMATMEAELSVR